MKQKLEALLFASGRKMELKELAKLCGTRNLEQVKLTLTTLQQEYSLRDCALKLIEEGESWKLSVKEEFAPFVRQIVSETELTKSMMETLAVIAWKNPALQSDIIHIRTNKAYDHLDQLEEAGYINRAKFGRTRKITLTERFFSYFDLPNQQEAQAEFRKFIPEEIRAKVEAAEVDIMKGEKVLEEEALKKKLDEEKQKQLKVYEEAGELLSFAPSPQPEQK
ncbi:SMC-Scp complex subunit ScpB [Candidatus Woesearchaeota archaeon]|nr:SMC-Scp complex subunit ScpB [Candidatus Woesearchaeota archaeon]